MTESIASKNIAHRVAGFAVFFVCFTVLSIAGVLSYLSSVQLIQRGVEMDLTAMSSFAVSRIDGDAHEALRQINGENPNAFKFQNDRLKDTLRRFPNLSYVYTIYRDKGDLRFLLDPTEPGDRDGDGVDDKSYPGDIVEEPSPVMIQTLESGRSLVESEPFTDQWGTSISAYSPIFDQNGFVVGLVGVDLNLANYNSKFHAAALGLLAWIVFSLLCSSAFGWYLSNSIRIVREGVNQIIKTQLQIESQNRELENLNITLDEQARYDSLTKLYSRAAFEKICQESIFIGLNDPDKEIALAFIDLDNFKLINDSFGHEHGDELLIEFSSRLVNIATDASVGRFGGDEFLVLMVGERAQESLVERLGQFISSLETPILVNGQVHRCSISVGVAKLESEGTSSDLIRMADIAMYRAKSSGKNGLVLFEDEMGTSVQVRASLENELREAWTNGELWVAIQPIVNLKEQRVSGGELLMRWTKSDGTVVPPSLFIPIVEENGMILELGLWMIERACIKLQSWAFDQNLSNATIAVNVSGRQLIDEDFVAKVHYAIDCYSFDRSRLIIEVTESMMIDESMGIDRKLKELKDMGLQVALDDFGTGYSSLSMLSRLPIDYLKIDQSFVMGMTSCSRTMSLTHSILLLAKGLGLKVIGEGIEELAHSQTLIKMGCDFGQGFIFSRPIPIDEFHLQIDGKSDIKVA